MYSYICMGFLFGLMKLSLSSIKGLVFGIMRGMRLFMFLVFLTGLAIGVAVVLLLQKPNRGEVKGKLIRQDADVLRVEMPDGGTRDVRLLFKEGANLELKGHLSGNLLEVKEIEAR